MERLNHALRCAPCGVQYASLLGVWCYGAKDEAHCFVVGNNRRMLLPALALGNMKGATINLEGGMIRTMIVTATASILNHRMLMVVPSIALFQSNAVPVHGARRGCEQLAGSCTCHMSAHVTCHMSHIFFSHDGMAGGGDRDAAGPLWFEVSSSVAQ